MTVRGRHDRRISRSIHSRLFSGTGLRCTLHLASRFSSSWLSCSSRYDHSCFLTILRLLQALVKVLPHDAQQAILRDWTALYHKSGMTIQQFLAQLHHKLQPQVCNKLAAKVSGGPNLVGAECAGRSAELPHEQILLGESPWVNCFEEEFAAGPTF